VQSAFDGDDFAAEGEEQISRVDDDWVSGTDPSSGHQYYYNTKTNESSWEIPTTDKSPSDRAWDPVPAPAAGSIDADIPATRADDGLVSKNSRGNSSHIHDGSGEVEQAASGSFSPLSHKAKPDVEVANGAGEIAEAPSPNKSMSIREMRAQFFSAKSNSPGTHN
jgi:hypothetical protein